MAKKKWKFKLTPAGILFLAAIGVLIIALIAVIAVLGSSCKGDSATRGATASASPSAAVNIPDLPVVNDTAAPSDEPVTPTDTPEPDTTPANITGLDPITTPETAVTSPDAMPTVGITTPQPQNTTPTPTATTTVYKSPTSKQKKAAKDGYIYKDDVNMRKGPGKNYELVKKDLAKNTTVTLYELQDGWWFLKCGSSYGYIKKDFIKEGKPAATPKPTATSKANSTYDGTIKTNSVAALRKSADKSSTCIKELSNGDKVTVHYKTKGKDGNTWYYVTAGKNKGYVISSLLSTSSKVPTK